MTIWRMRIACWIPKAINTHSEYVILITFPLQQWFHDSASLLRHNTLPVLFKEDFLVRLEPSSSVQGTGHKSFTTRRRQWQGGVQHSDCEVIVFCVVTPCSLSER